MDHDVLKIRQCMRDAIFIKLQKLNPIPTDGASKAKDLDAAKRLEEGIYKMALTKEDYLNPSTLESRLASLLNGTQLTNYNQLPANSSSVGTMITTTPGVPAEPTMDKDKLLENGDQCETEIAENPLTLKMIRRSFTDFFGKHFHCFGNKKR